MIRQAKPGPHRTKRVAVLALTAALLLSGCGATVESASGRSDVPNAEAFPITITNCGKKVTYENPPKRTVVNDIGMIEMMFALGLADRIAGYFKSDSKEAVRSSPWQEDFDKAPRLGEYPSWEKIRAVRADMVFAGWNYGYDRTANLTPKGLAENGIASYTLTESCHNGKGRQRGIMPPLQALYTDLRNLGKIYGVSERAAELIEKYKSTVAEVQKMIPDDARAPKVFLYDSGTKQPLTAGWGAAASQVITKAGGRNIFGDLRDSWTTVTWEAVVRADPDVILINDYGEKSAKQKIRFLKNFPPLAEVDAVKHERFFVLPYAALVESPRNPSAIKAFAEYLW